MCDDSVLSTETKEELYHTQAYHAAGEAIMSFTPISKIHQHLCAFHTPSNDRTKHIRSHHFCTHLRPDLHQCVIYDSDDANARLIGIEYIVPEEAYASFDEEERKLWHSHKYEVESGMLVLVTKSGVPNAATDLAEQPAMLELHKTYGKTIHTWPSNSLTSDFPLGAPELMMSYTADGQLPKEKLEEHNTYLGISSASKRELRNGEKGYLPPYEKHPDADSWERGSAPTLQFVDEPIKK